MWKICAQFVKVSELTEQLKKKKISGNITIIKIENHNNTAEFICIKVDIVYFLVFLTWLMYKKISR